MEYHALMYHAGPELDAPVLAHAEERREIVVVGLDHRIGNARKYVRKMVRLEMLRHREHELDHHLHLLAAVETLLRMQAVVAVAAIVLAVILAEIVEQHLAAALVGLGVGHRVPQQLTAYLLLGNRLALHELFKLLYVLLAVICKAYTLLSVAAGTSRLLIITLQALWDIVMYDETHVRLVYAHAEGYGRHYHVHVLAQEAVLVLGPDFRIQAGVVRQGPDVVDAQEGSELLHLLAAQAIYDAGTARMLAYEAHYVLLRIRLVPYFIIEVGPVEGGFEHTCVAYAQILQYVALHLRGRRCRQGDERRRAYFVNYRTYLAVFRTEVVPPFGDTVGLVYGVEGYLYSLEQGYVLGLRERFRSHVQQLGLPGNEIVLDLLYLCLGKGGVEEMGYALVPILRESPDCIDLVLHQGDQRGYDYGSPFHNKCGKLVAQGFSSSRRHQHKGIPSRNEMAYYGFLISLERVVTEEIFQLRMQSNRIGFHRVLIFI